MIKHLGWHQLLCRSTFFRVEYIQSDWFRGLIYISLITYSWDVSFTITIDDLNTNHLISIIKRIISNEWNACWSKFSHWYVRKYCILSKVTWSYVKYVRTKGCSLFRGWRSPVLFAWWYSYRWWLLHYL
jgi:hypothetical protein